jgi:ABC-2 type transport system permease protein
MSSAQAALPAPAASDPRAHPRTWTVVRWELRKLLSQKRTYLGLAIAIAFPLIFVTVEHFHGGHHRGGGNIFFSHVSESGLVTPVLTLLLESVILLPLAAALVAGDIVAAEDGNGTLKTILTRSVDRGQVFAAKAITAILYAAIVTFASAIVATVIGIAFWGFHPVITFSGTVVSAPKALLLVAVANLCYLIPLTAIVSIGVLLSTVSRNSTAAVVGTLGLILILAIVSTIPGLEGLQPYLMTNQEQGWQGLLRVPTDWAPIAHSAWVCALYAVPSLFVAYLVFLRRDVAGG